MGRRFGLANFGRGKVVSAQWTGLVVSAIVEPRRVSQAATSVSENPTHRQTLKWIGCYRRNPNQGSIGKRRLQFISGDYTTSSIRDFLRFTEMQIATTGDSSCLQPTASTTTL